MAIDGAGRYSFGVDLKHLKRAARQQGWTVELANGGHLKWTPPTDSPIVFSPSTPSDWRAIANIVSRLRKSGFVAPGDQHR